MRIGIVCYPTFGGSGVLATELGKALADKGHQVHFITYQQPVRLNEFNANIFYHEVRVTTYPLDGAGEALEDLRSGRFTGAGVIEP